MGGAIVVADLWGMALAFVTGTVAGSFANVCIHRIPRGESIVSPGSRCPACSAPIRWHDNVPLLGFLLLRGRCRRCRRPIGWRYPLVEALVGAAFAATVAAAGWGSVAVAAMVLETAAVVAAFIGLGRAGGGNR